MPTLNEITERFRLLAGRTRPPAERAEIAEHISTPAAIRSNELRDWAAGREGSLMIAWLHDEIATASLATHAAARSASPEVNYWLGMEAGIRRIRDEMQIWRGERPGISPGSPA